MRAATIFSGIGAPEEAMPEWDWVWHAEIEKFPCAVMAKRHPKSINLGDVNGTNFIERAVTVGRPDVLVFGSPCQGFSVAGKRLGLDDHRSNLALHGLAIARDVGAEWLVFENVPGLYSSYSGGDEAEGSVREGDVGGRAECDEDSDFASFLAAVRECGYFGAFRTFDAQYSGVPQRRRRIFFVGRLGDWRGPAAVLFEPESLRGDRPPSRTAGEGIAPTISARPTGGGGLGTDFDCDGGLITGAVSSKWHKGTGGPAGDECYNLVAPIPILESGARTGRVGHEGVDGLGIGEPGDPMFSLQASKQHAVAFDTTQITHPSNRSSVGDWSPPVTESGHPPAVAFQRRVARNGRGSASYETETMIAHPLLAKSNSSHDDSKETYVAHSLRADGFDASEDGTGRGAAVRRLTPRECERLQGFPDDYTAVNFRGKPAADGPRYKALGNSMAVPVVQWILTRIEAIDKIIGPCDNPD